MRHDTLHNISHTTLSLFILLRIGIGNFGVIDTASAEGSVVRGPSGIILRNKHSQLNSYKGGVVMRPISTIHQRAYQSLLVGGVQRTFFVALGGSDEFAMVREY